MTARQLITLIALFASVALFGCGDGGKKPAASNEYDVKGKVVSIDLNKPAVTLDHEDIPGLMKAMTMEFRVENAKVLEGLKAGDAVQGRLKKSDGGYTILRLEKR
jgi:Cu/Ag efflux protein CusF